jgi:hypothetical protein
VENMEKKSNVAKGRTSFDADIGNTLVPFLNRNITPYATEAGSVKFDLIPVEKQKDVMVNVARMHAQQEYDRIMELVAVLQKQAAQIKRRLDLTDMVHSAKYDFQIYHGQLYWLLFDSKINATRLCLTGPNDWNTGKPAQYEYICRVKWLGDHTWIEIDEEGNYVN